MDNFFFALMGSLISPVAIVSFLAVFRDKILDHYFATRLARIKGDIKQVLDTHHAMLQRQERRLEAALELGTTVDLDLRERRIKAYEDLWKQTAIVPRWPRSMDVTYNRLKQFSGEMRTWYFEKGGMYLSKESQDSYSDLQKLIWEILGGLGKNHLDDVIEGSELPESKGHYDLIRRRCSSLRTSFTKDILSRRAAPVPDITD